MEEKPLQAKKAKKSQTQAQGIELKRLLSQWREQRPDLDPTPMAICGEIWRASERLKRAILANLSGSGLDITGFDVLLTLRRQGKSAALSPSALAREMMLSTSAMTNRLDRLEKQSLVERRQIPSDRRSLAVVLTAKGFQLADKLVSSHVETERVLIEKLSPKQQQLLCSLLGKVG